MKKTFVVSIVLVFLMLSISGCKSVDQKAIEAGYVKPVSNEGLVVYIDASGSQDSFGDPVNGRKIIVRDDLPKNENGWFDREVYEISSLNELGISEKFKADFVVEYERDYSQKDKAYVPYFTMNISNQVPTAEIQAFLEKNPKVVSTSVVNRVDPQGNMQECSLEGLQPDAIRFVLYHGDNIAFQVCTADLKKP